MTYFFVLGPLVGLVMVFFCIAHAACTQVASGK